MTAETTFPIALATHGLHCPDCKRFVIYVPKGASHYRTIINEGATAYCGGEVTRLNDTEAVMSKYQEVYGG